MAGFVTDIVEDELAYGMESLGLAPDVMRQRVEETLDLLGLAELRHRPLAPLSGGQQQRVAIGAVLTTHPRVLVLDEPTSALDPLAAEEVLAALQRLVHDLGITVVLAEHRLERVVQYADRVVLVAGRLGCRSSPATPATMLRDLAGRPAGRRARPRSPAGRRCRCRCATPAAGPPDRCARGWTPYGLRRTRRSARRRASVGRGPATWSCRLPPPCRCCAASTSTVRTGEIVA